MLTQLIWQQKGVDGFNYFSSNEVADKSFVNGTIRDTDLFKIQHFIHSVHK